MRIEAVTVCVDYADYLNETAQWNRGLLDRLLVITRRGDDATLDVCHRLNLECIQTDDFYRNGNGNGKEFNKGRAIERGLGMLAHDDWVLHIDSDIALPLDFRDSLLDADLDKECIYGVDRHLLKSVDDWLKWKARGSTRGYHCYQRTLVETIGARWVDIRYGYVPIGYFQLWHQSADIRKGIRTRRYPEWHSDAARADVKFALQWDRRRRQLLPEIIVGHLENGGKMGANWKGRTTPKFGVERPHPHPHPHPHPPHPKPYGP